MLRESVGGNGVTVLTTVAPIFQTGDRELFPCLFRPDRTVSELFCLLKSRIRVADKIHCSTRDPVQKELEQIGPVSAPKLKPRPGPGPEAAAAARARVGMVSP